jgi:5-methyltetrahydrofolate--homocysteine methyltransferase
LLVPLGAMTYDEAVDAFAEQIAGLKEGGAEVAWIETMSAPDEAKAAAEAAIKVGLPYTYTFSFDTAGRSMMGLAPKDVHHIADGLPEKAVAVGANCGVGASDILSSLLDMSAAKPDATIIVKGNCGIPEFRGTEIHYSGTPELMSDYVRLAVDAGAKIVGGCCGTSFAHLAAMRKALDGHVKAERPTVETIIERIGPLRNKTADKSGSTGETSEARRERRRARA